MALLTGETFTRGFVVYTDGSIVVTNSTSGAAWRNGFMRDSDGRLVIVDG